MDDTWKLMVAIVAFGAIIALSMIFLGVGSPDIAPAIGILR